MTESKIGRKEKWKNISINHQNVDEYMQDLYDDTKLQHINQAVNFNKDDPYHMGLLRLVLMEPQSFASFVRQLIANHYSNTHLSGQDARNVNGYIPTLNLSRKATDNDAIKNNNSEVVYEKEDKGEVKNAVSPSTSSHSQDNDPASSDGKPSTRRRSGSKGGALGALLE